MDQTPGSSKPDCCAKCGWRFQNRRPSAKHRRAHNNVCRSKDTEANTHAVLSDGDHSDEKGSSVIGQGSDDGLYSDDVTGFTDTGYSSTLTDDQELAPEVEMVDNDSNAIRSKKDCEIAGYINSIDPTMISSELSCSDTTVTLQDYSMMITGDTEHSDCDMPDLSDSDKMYKELKEMCKEVSEKMESVWQGDTKYLSDLDEMYKELKEICKEESEEMESTWQGDTEHSDCDLSDDKLYKELKEMCKEVSKKMESILLGDTEHSNCDLSDSDEIYKELKEMCKEESEEMEKLTLKWCEEMAKKQDEECEKMIEKHDEEMEQWEDMIRNQYDEMLKKQREKMVYQYMKKLDDKKDKELRLVRGA